VAADSCTETDIETERNAHWAQVAGFLHSDAQTFSARESALE